VSTLTNIVNTRKRLKKSTFCTCVDFKKADDFIDRSLLWNKLIDKFGINGNIIVALKSLNANITSTVRVNGYYTDSFCVQCGHRQGCSMSPILFKVFVNDLAVII